MANIGKICTPGQIQVLQVLLVMFIRYSYCNCCLLFSVQSVGCGLRKVNWSIDFICQQCWK